MPPHHLVRDARGATAIEYGLIIGSIALALIPAIMSLAAQEDQTYQQAAFGLGVEARKSD